MIRAHIDLLKSYSLSITSVRLAVLHALHSHAHADADTIFQVVQKEISTASKQAIYNNLHTLVEHGLIREIRPKGQPSLYELRVGDNHHHLVCRQCQTVTDVECPDSARCLEPFDNHGFIIDEAEVTFWGLCPACLTTQSAKGEKP